MVIQLPSNLRILGKSLERRDELKDRRGNSDRENERIHNEFDIEWCKMCEACVGEEKWVNTESYGQIIMLLLK